MPTNTQSYVMKSQKNTFTHIFQHQGILMTSSYSCVSMYTAITSPNLMKLGINATLLETVEL